jgi:putative SOS response-associated peptidase YedK
VTALYRCRGSADEIRNLFDCNVERGFTWSPFMRPGRDGVVIVREGPHRVAWNVRWGFQGMASQDRRDIWSDFNPMGDHLFGRDPGRVQRCLIVLDSFALPDGPKGLRTRSWFGLWDEPLFAWAGVIGEIDRLGSAFVGAMTSANELVKRVAPSMPAILAPDDYQRWLFGSDRDVTLLAKEAFDPDAMWLEQTDELWTSGISIDDLAASQTRRRPAR